MTRLLLCGFGPFPGAQDNPAALAVEQLAQDRWSPAGAQTDYAVLPTVWREAAQTVLAAAVQAEAVLLVGVASSALAFRVETVARNRASQVHADAAGQCWSGPMIDPNGPAERGVTAPVHAMVRAIQDLGLTADLSRDAGDYLCNFTLYRLLAQQPMTAFLHVPPISQAISLDDIVKAVRAAASALAKT